MSQIPEDDRTVLSTGSVQAPDDHPAHPGDEPTHALQAGTRLGEFEITELLGEGGFGIVYLAWDSSLERQVALKEYMPSFASRSTRTDLQAQVSVRSSANADSFEAGLRSFINEARLLAQFDHPSLVKVYRFWEANGTAYMVMPYYRGPTLKQALKARAAPPDEAWLKDLLAPLLDALEVIHRHSCYHRDIAPDNILMLDEGRPLLLDFGAARRAIGGMNQAFTVILKQNYAPIEQYAEMPGMSQGAWTDLYALASVVHFAIDGHAPPPAVSRMLADPYVPLATRYAGRYSESFLEAIDRALAFRPENRPRDVAAMRALLGFEPAAAREITRAQPAPAVPALAPEAAQPPARRRPLVIGGVSVLLLGAAGLFAWLNRDVARPEAAPVVAGVAAQPAAAPVKPAPPTAAPFDPVAALDAVLAGASLDRKVTVQASNPRVRIARDLLGFSIRSSHAGYVYVHMVGTEGNDFHQFFPNAFDKENRIAAGEVLTLPRRSWPVKAGGPPGTDRLLVMVSDAPRDFSAAGLTAGNPFSVFPLERAAALQRAYTGWTPLFAGVPVCKEQPCPATYGAAAFSIDEISATD